MKKGGSVTKPSDFTAERVIEVDQPAPDDSRTVIRHIWVARLIGGGLLLGSLGILAVTLGFPSTEFLVSAAVLITFAAYVFVSEQRARSLTVNVEKRLRLGLLVHNMELENMAMQDDLTQLFNRRYLFERLERELETAKAFKRPLSVIVVDLNSMKFVNDNYGHRIGDALLSAFGRFLLDFTRASDVPARIGGDEFAIILPDTSDRAAQTLKQRLTTRLDAITLVEEDDVTVKVTAAFGVAGYPKNGDSVDELMQQADLDMYVEKGARKGGVTVETRSGKSGKLAPAQLEQAS
jgi:diguanylate cyclase (GGDEF)-like protein